MSTILIVPVLAFCLLLNTCVSSVEVARAVSPDRQLVATVTEINGGATTSFAYRVDVGRDGLVRWDHLVASFYGAIRSDCAYGVNIRWADNDTLVVSYKDAKEANAAHSEQLSGRTIRILAQPGIDDPSAPCGGMEYGQQGKVSHIR